jgi:hypothetical protein
MATIIKPKCGAPCLKGLPPVSAISKNFPPGAPKNTNPIIPCTESVPVVDDVPDAPKSYGLYKIKVLVISFLPPGENGKIEIGITGDVETPIIEMRAKVAAMTLGAIEKLEAGSSYRQYSNAASTPTCSFQVVGRIEFAECYPTTRGTQWGGFDVPLVDYKTILKRVNGQAWVEQQNVTQIWIFGYHGEKVTLWESNMSSSFGNVSNSGRLKGELPLYNKTFTVYNYNYGRDMDTILEDHCHQMEALLNFVDKRDETPEFNWPKLLFWGLFVGSDKTAKMIKTNGRFRCGWTHYPPNGTKDYDWQNKTLVLSDLFDWNPQGTGQARMMNAADWNLNDDGGVAWKVKWLQSIPNANNGLQHNGKPLTNWWSFYGDFDAAMNSRKKLTE